MKKTKILFFVLILLILTVFISFNSHSSIQNAMNDSSTAKNFSGTGSWSNLTYIKIAKHATISSATLNISSHFLGGISNEFLNTETINISSNEWDDIDIDIDSNNNIHVVACYYDSADTNGYVYYFKKSSGSWTTELVTSGISGEKCSIAVDTNNIPHICYEDEDNDFNTGRIKYTNKTTGSWTTIDLSGASTEDICSIDLDSNNNVGVAIMREGGTSDRVRYRFYNQTTQSWALEEVISSSGINGLTLDLKFDSNNLPHISSVTLTAPRNLYYSNRSNGSWTSTIVESGSSGSGVGDGNAIFLDSNNKAHISYQSIENTQFKYANNTLNTWNTGIVESFSSLALSKSDIVLDSSNNPAIFYVFDNGSVDQWNLAYFDSSWNYKTILTRPDLSLTLSAAMAIDNNNALYLTYSNESHLFYSDNGIYASNVTLDVGNDGDTEFNHSGEFSTNNQTSDFASEITDFLSTCLAVNGYCDVPLNISGTNGKVEILNINITYTATPYISILTPLNDTNSTDTQLDLNFTYQNYTNLDSCWWSNDSGLNNYTISNCLNLTTQVWQEGLNTITLYINDSDNSQNSTEVSFRIDTIAPTIAILFPVNNTAYTTNNLDLNYSVSDATLLVSQCWYNIYNGTDYEISNTTLTDCNNSNFSVADSGEYNLTLYANDSLNNLNYSKIGFSVSLNAPAITLHNPTNNKYLNYSENILFNFTASDSNGLQTCELWTNYSGWALNLSKSISGTSNTTNFTQNFTEGVYLWNINCSDTTAQSGFAASNKTFTIDTTYPLVNITNISTTVGSQTINFNHTTSDTYLDECNITVLDSNNSIDGIYDGFEITCNEVNRALTVSTFGTFTLILYSKDLAGNLNLTNQSFAVSDSPSGGTGGGGGGGTSIVEITRSEASNFSVESITGSKLLDIILAKNSVRPRIKKFYLRNTDIEQVTVNIACNPTENTSNLNICDYVTIQNTTVTIPPSEIELVENTIKILTPENASFGDVYNFNIVATTQTETQLQFSKLSVQARVPYWGIVYKWNNMPLTEGRFYYPAFGLALLAGIVFLISSLGIAGTKYRVTGFLVGMLGLILVLILVLLI